MKLTNLKTLQFGRVVGDRDRDPVAAESSWSPDSMQVGCRLPWDLHVDDKIDVGSIDASGAQIRGQQDSAVVLFQTVQRS